MSKHSTWRAMLLSSACALIATATAAAQEETDDADGEDRDVITVVGSQIRGKNVADTLPVTVLDVNDIDTTAAIDGDELFRSIPQAGDVAFQETRTTGGVNDARGDVASINLRSFGTGYTLVLLNGRRMVLHPGYQTENLVPVQTVNTNAIPVMGIQRVEVLRDGAAAIYGTDAVAGVVNTVLKDDFEGLTTSVQYGGSEGTSLRELILNSEYGVDFNEGRSNLGVFVNYLDREGMPSSDKEYAASANLLPFVVGTDFEGDTDFDNRSTNTPWGVFEAAIFDGTIRQDGTALTNSAGRFHIQPSGDDDLFPGCLADLPGGLCIDNASPSSSTTSSMAGDRLLRYDIQEARTLASDVERFNAFAFFNHDFDNGLEFFAEGGFFSSQSDRFREQASSLTATRMFIPASNYYNPFGPVEFANGSANPNRLSGLNIPDEGVDLLMANYRAIDVGPREIDVSQDSFRLLAGLRGDLGNWSWESAALHSEATTNDTTHNRISNTLFQQALALSTPDAYNPFNGGDLNNLSGADATPNPQSVIDSFTIDVERENKTELTLWDANFSNPALFALPAGDIGMAVGLEWRREAFEDDRDPRLDGTITFTDMVSGDTSGSDVLGSSPTPDSSGDRNVASAYVELAVPVVSPDMNIPLVDSFDLQLAARFEDYSDFGDVVKPKVAFGWRPFEPLLIRGSWSENFRAPNLPQLYERGVERSNTRTDYIRCEADLRNGVIDTFDDCGRSQGVLSQRSGSLDLEPETSTTTSFGLAYQPEFASGFTFTADYWSVEQEDVIGIFSDSSAIALDYLLRVRGESNPAVVRADPNPEDIEDFAGSGLAPVGDILYVEDPYVNLLPREIEGVDLGVYYRLDDTKWGDFDFKFNAAHLISFDQEPDEDSAAIIAAQDSGEISSGFTVRNAESLLLENGRPEWRYSWAMWWRGEQWGAGVNGQYVSEVYDTGATTSEGEQWVVDEWSTVNAYVQYEFEDGFAEDTRLRLGVRNMFDEDPSLADDSFGYLGDLHSNRGRYFYVNVRKQF